MSSKRFSLRRSSTVEIDNVEYDIEWIQRVDVDRELYGADLDGNRGEWRDYVEAEVECITSVEPKTTKEIESKIEIAIEIENRDLDAVNEELCKMEDDDDDGSR